mmetsp:Transcript_89216/g.213018  ORF Transcript_89216/g.213018 Transcript_89216/m.213018 type:complete len:358 (+) Transcript_89216:6131-7204(+)
MLQAWVEVLQQLQVHHVPLLCALDQMPKELHKVHEDQEGWRRSFRAANLKQVVVGVLHRHWCSLVPRPGHVKVPGLGVEGHFVHGRQCLAHQLQQLVLHKGDLQALSLLLENRHLLIDLITSHLQEDAWQDQAERELLRSVLPWCVWDLNEEEILLGSAVVDFAVVSVAEHAHNQQLEQQRVHMAGQDVGQVDVHRSGRGWVRGVAQQVRHQGRDVCRLPDLHMVQERLVFMLRLQFRYLLVDVVRLAHSVRLCAYRLHRPSMILLSHHGNGILQHLLLQDAHRQVVPVESVHKHLIGRSAGKDQGTRMLEAELLLHLPQRFHCPALRHVGQQMHISHAVQPILPTMLPGMEEAAQE